jgi:hypothetical protein
MGDFEFDDVIRTAHVIVNPEQAAKELADLRTENAQLVRSNSAMSANLDYASADIGRLRADLTDTKARNEIFEGCLHRALKLWQARHPDAEFWPDGAVNLAWVFDRLSEAEKVLDLVAKQNDGIHSPFDIIHMALDWLAAQPKAKP